MTCIDSVPETAGGSVLARPDLLNDTSQSVLRLCKQLTVRRRGAGTPTYDAAVSRTLPFLVVGTQRTGTSAIAEQVGLHPAITCGWESTNHVWPFRRIAVAEQVLAGDFRNLLEKEREYLAGVHHEGKRALGFRRLFRSSAKWLIGPSWAPALWADRLEAHLKWLRRRPEIHVIHITRSDNLAWLKSMGLAKATDSYVGKSYPQDAAARWSLGEAHRRVLTKHWIGRRLATLRQSNPYINVSYEGFRADNAGVVGELVEFLGFDQVTSGCTTGRIRPQSSGGAAAQFENAGAVAGLLEARGLLYEPPPCPRSPRPLERAR
jgi:hypothetical protein